VEFKPVGVFYQPPRKGYCCSECGARITNRSKTGLCVSCCAKRMLHQANVAKNQKKEVMLKNE